MNGACGSHLRSWRAGRAWGPLRPPPLPPGFPRPSTGGRGGGSPARAPSPHAGAGPGRVSVWNCSALCTGEEAAVGDRLLLHSLGSAFDFLQRESDVLCETQKGRACLPGSWPVWRELVGTEVPCAPVSSVPLVPLCSRRAGGASLQGSSLPRAHPYWHLWDDKPLGLPVTPENLSQAGGKKAGMSLPAQSCLAACSTLPSASLWPPPISSRALQDLQVQALPSERGTRVPLLLSSPAPTYAPTSRSC